MSHRRGEVGRIIPTMNYKYFLCFLGIILSLPILLLIAFAFTVPISISGIGYLLAYSLVISGLIIAPWTNKYHLALIIMGVLGVVLIAGTRIVLTRNSSTTNLRMIALPEGKETRWINYIVDEQDSVIFGEAIFHRIGGDSQNEHQGITSALSSAYSEMNATEGIFPSPFISTYLNLQQPENFDTIVIEPKVNLRPQTAVIFLHGFMGNVTAQCWEIAQAVDKFGAVTVCPSTGWRGDWWLLQGVAIIQATFTYLREHGIQRFYLGGFSNGGFGISRLIPDLGNEDGLVGLFFIDGVYNGSDILAAGLPVLIIQGTQDERMPATLARQTSETIGTLGTYMEFEGDHFLIMKHPELVKNVIARWLQDHESNK